MSQSGTGARRGLIAALMILGILFVYVCMVNPGAVLTEIMGDLGIDSIQDATTSAMSAIYFGIIPFSFLGVFIQNKIGIKKQYILCLIVGAIGMLGLLFVQNSTQLFIIRVIYGIGYGLYLPFFGAATMKWFKPNERDTMDAINAAFPYIANVIVYGLTIPMMEGFGGSWRMSLGIWGVFCIAVAIIWIIGVRGKALKGVSEDEDSTEQTNEKGIWKNVMSRKDIWLLVIVFVANFFSYGAITAVLPTFCELELGYTAQQANNQAMIFAVSGIIAVAIALTYAKVSGKRKMPLIVGALMILLGGVFFYLGGGEGFLGNLGVILMGLGNSFPIMSIALIPMELPDMTPNRAGAAVTMLFAIAFFSGIFSPMLAGWIGDNWSLLLAILVSSLLSIFGVIAGALVKETGPGRKKKEAAEITE